MSPRDELHQFGVMLEIEAPCAFGNMFASHRRMPFIKFSDGNVNLLQLILRRCVRVINMIITYYVLINNMTALKTNCHIRIEVHRDANIRTKLAERISCLQVRFDGD